MPFNPHGYVDYSLLSPAFHEGVSYATSKVHSVDLGVIDRYLRELWESAPLGTPNDVKCLAEIDTDSVSDWAKENSFTAKFNEPKIKALCPEEVVLFFHLSEITWSRDQDNVR